MNLFVVKLMWLKAFGKSAVGLAGGSLIGWTALEFVVCNRGAGTVPRA
jgi:hypothetical protein